MNWVELKLKLNIDKLVLLVRFKNVVILILEWLYDGDEKKLVWVVVVVVVDLRREEEVIEKNEENFCLDWLKKF